MIQVNLSLKDVIGLTQLQELQVSGPTPQRLTQVQMPRGEFKKIYFGWKDPVNQKYQQVLLDSDSN